MGVHFHRKQPDEEYTITEDFAMYRLESAENISNQVVTAEDSSGVDVTSTLLGSITRANGIISIPIKNGTNGERYTIKVLVTTDAGNKYEQDLVLGVSEKP